MASLPPTKFSNAPSLFEDVQQRCKEVTSLIVFTGGKIQARSINGKNLHLWLVGFQ
jgi:hypothetical protein